MSDCFEDAPNRKLNSKTSSVKICDDVFFDLLHFLQREDHQRVNSVSRRLRWLSASVERRYPSRAIRALLVSGMVQSDQHSANSVEQPPHFVGNSLSACPLVGAPYAVDFATVGPPANISRIIELEISDFIGPQLIQFLGISAPLLDGCCLIFDDFENFVQIHSVQFVRQFFALFPVNRSVELRFVSSVTAPLFVLHPSLFGCIELGIECTADFPLDCLHGWLCQDETFEGIKPRRFLDFRFSTLVHVQHCLDAVQNFVNSVRQRFLHATNCCPFSVEIELLGGPHIPELDSFTELNERTEEMLTFTRDRLVRLYFLERRRQSCDRTENEQQMEDGVRIEPFQRGANGSAAGADHDRESAHPMYCSVVFIRQILQGDCPTG